MKRRAKMKPDEIKLHVSNYTNGIIDKVFPENDGVLGKIKNTTAKYWVKQNIWRLDDVLGAFIDSVGEIDIQEALNFYDSSLFDSNGKITVNLQDIGKTKILPSKIVILTRKDLYNIFGLDYD